VSEQAVPALALTPLDRYLAERGPLPLEEAFAILRALVAAVRALHASGRIHRSITPQSVYLDEGQQVLLAPPEPVRKLGGMDREINPPELLGAPALDLPDDLAACRTALERAGIALDPRRIDVYHLGVLFCRLLTLQPVAAYLQSPACKARVPATVRPLLERALGYRPELRLADCQALAALLDTVAQAEPITVLPTTPCPESADPRFISDPGGTGNGSAIDTPLEECISAEACRRTGDTPAETSLPFERLGPYRILERLGRGGMGEVYLGYETALERRVAIKVLPPDLAQSGELMARFRAEATAVAQLSHPNIVPIYAIGEDAGYPFFVMQFIEGESLERRLERQGRLPVDEAIDLLEQCLAGLEAVHQAGLVHRDLKPGNILLERSSGRALLADFGLVKKNVEAGNLTTAGMVLGTPDYLAPEQARAQMVDRRADLYALGVVAYQMLSGRLPFEAETPSRMIAQHAQVTALPLAQAAPAIARPLATLVDRLLARDPAQRYASCADVLADLRALKNGWPPGGSARAQARAARPRVRPMLAMVAGMVLVAGAFSLPSLYWPRRPPQDYRPVPDASISASLTDPPRARLDIPREPPGLPPVIQPGGSVADPRRPAAPSVTTVAQLPLIVRKELRRFETPGRNITAMVFSPDGRHLLTAGDQDRLLRLWDVESGRQIGHIDNRGQRVNTLAFAPDGHRVAAGNTTGELSLYDLDTFEERRRFQGHRAWIHSVAFSPDGKQLLSTSQDNDSEDNTARLWDVATGRELNQLNNHRRALLDAAFCGDGRKVLVATGGGREGGGYMVRLWDLETGDLLPRYQGVVGNRLTVTADGRRALCAGDGCFLVWDPETGRILRRIPLRPPAGYYGLGVSPDGLYLATGGSERFVYLYDVQSAQEVCRFEGKQGAVLGVLYSPDGRFLASSGDGGAVHLWELPVLSQTVPFGKGEICRFQGHTAAVTSVAFSPDSRRVLSGALDNTVRLWDIGRGQEARCFLGHADVVRSVAFTPGGRYVLSGGDDRTVRVWSLATGRELRCFPHPSAVTAVACSPEGRRLATAAEDYTLRLWDLDTGEQVQGFYGHENRVRGLTFTADGRWLVSAGDDAVRLWDVATGQERRPVDYQAPGRLAFTPDGPRFYHPRLKAWVTPERLLKEDDGRPTMVEWPRIGPFQARALSTDLRTLLAPDGNNLKLTEPGVVGARSLSGHSAEVTAVAISPDGQLAVSGSADQSVRVWGLGR
jgi:WD40 repeat protein/serine/threonine protein kinase